MRAGRERRALEGQSTAHIAESAMYGPPAPFGSSCLAGQTRALRHPRRFA